MGINERVKMVRKHKSINLTQRKFGERLGVKDNAISRIESGENGVTEQMLLSICREFDISEDWLRTGEGNMIAQKDEAIIFEIVSKLKLDDMAKNILFAYKTLNDKQRDGVRAFIQALSESVIRDNAITAFMEAHGALDAYNENENEKELHDRVVNSFTDNFQFIDFPNPHYEDDDFDEAAHNELYGLDKKIELVVGMAASSDDSRDTKGGKVPKPDKTKTAKDIGDDT